MIVITIPRFRGKMILFLGLPTVPWLDHPRFSVLSPHSSETNTIHRKPMQTESCDLTNVNVKLYWGLQVSGTVLSTLTLLSNLTNNLVGLWYPALKKRTLGLHT